jgi:hypothetical protein
MVTSYDKGNVIIPPDDNIHVIITTGSQFFLQTFCFISFCLSFSLSYRFVSHEKKKFGVSLKAKWRKTTFPCFGAINFSLPVRIFLLQTKNLHTLPLSYTYRPLCYGVTTTGVALCAKASPSKLRVSLSELQ